MEWRRNHDIELEVLSSLTRKPGTIVKEAERKKCLSACVAKDTDVPCVSIIGVPDKPGLAFKIFSRLASKNINVDIILQSIGRNGTKDISFTVPKSSLESAISILDPMWRPLAPTALCMTSAL